MTSVPRTFLQNHPKIYVISTVFSFLSPRICSAFSSALCTRRKKYHNICRHPVPAHISSLSQDPHKHKEYPHTGAAENFHPQNRYSVLFPAIRQGNGRLPVPLLYTAPDICLSDLPKYLFSVQNPYPPPVWRYFFRKQDPRS